MTPREVWRCAVELAAGFTAAEVVLQVDPTVWLAAVLGVVAVGLAADVLRVVWRAGARW